VPKGRLRCAEASGISSNTSFPNTRRPDVRRFSKQLPRVLVFGPVHDSARIHDFRNRGSNAFPVRVCRAVPFRTTTNDVKSVATENRFVKPSRGQEEGVGRPGDSVVSHTALKPGRVLSFSGFRDRS